MTDEERRNEPESGPDYAELIEAASTPDERAKYRAAMTVAARINAMPDEDMTTFLEGEYDLAVDIMAGITEDILCDERLTEKDINNYFGRKK